jgi:hypothetical protein
MPPDLRLRDGQNREQTLEYVKAMLAQLRAMAEAEKCDMLAYLIEMAHLEASETLRDDSPSRIARKQPDLPSGSSK